MKKLLFSVIAFALITVSCNKYKDDFANLNARIDALAAQVQGVAALQTSITALQTSIAAVQTAVAAIPNNTAAITALQTSLTALTTTVNGINTSLGTVATNVTNLSALVTTLSATVTSNQAALLAAVTSAQNAITAAIAANNTTLAAAIQAQITALQASVNASITAATNTIIGDNANQTAVLTALIQQLQTAVAIANAQLNTLVNSNNIFVGDLTINDETTLQFAESLGAKVRAITGNLFIDASTFDAGQMTRLKNVTNNTLSLPAPEQNPFIGAVIGNVTLTGSQAVDLSKLVSVSGDGTTTGSITVTGGANHNLSGLVSVKNDYSITGGDVMDDALLTVGDDLTLDYPGTYSYPNLTTVVGTLTAVSYNGGVGNRTLGLSFPATASSVVFNDGSNPDGYLYYYYATSVNIKGSASLYYLEIYAGTINLDEDVYTNAAIEIWNPYGSSTTMAVVSVPGSLRVGAGWGLTSGSSTVNLNLFTTSGSYVEVYTSTSLLGATPGTANLPVYSSSRDLYIYGPATQTLAAYHNSASAAGLSSPTIKTLTLPVYRAQEGAFTQFDNLGALENLTIGDVRASISEASFAGTTTLKTLTATVGSNAAYTTYINLTGMANLQTVSTTSANEFRELLLVNNGNLVSVTTSGKMDRFILDGNNHAGLVVNLGHTAVTSINGQGTTVKVTNNANLASLTTSTSRMKELTVTGNASLATVNFASYIAGDNITAGVVTIAVSGNALVGTYTQSIFATNSAPVINQAGLSTIKAYASNILASVPHAGSTVNLNYRTSGVVDNVGGVGGLMDQDRAAFIVAGGTGATSFVQRDGDADGAVGSMIGVIRELGYIL